MKIINLYDKRIYIQYKHSVCSFAALFVLVVTIFAIVVPFYIAYYIYHDWWSQHKTVYEQPIVKYQHKFIFLAEYSNESVETDAQLVACNSFKYLNELLADYPDCSSIKFWANDYNNDQIIDQMNFQLIFQPPAGHKLNFFDLYLEFDTRMKSKCNLPIPSALILQQEPVPFNFKTGELTIEGRLNLHQTATFHCPFFLRNIKSHFFHNLVPENSTNIRDYNFEVIRTQITNNPGYLLFDKTNTYWNRNQENKTIINIVVRINQMRSLYHTSFWQKVGQLWIQYLSVFVIFWYAIDQLKHYMFTRQKIKAWELMPWKKMY